MRRYSLLILVALTLQAFIIQTTLATQTHKYNFVIAKTNITRLCKTHEILTVNGQFPGPTIRVRDGNHVLIKVVNKSPYNATIHWHGLHQFRNGWADGPEYVTQCPILPGKQYTYNFTISGQKGTLWWHAHSSWMRATVYGALIIYPKKGVPYPFPMPHSEEHLLIGEYWNKNPLDIIDTALETGGNPDRADALTINGEPGDLLPCSNSSTVKIRVKAGTTMLLRVINAGMNTEVFFAIKGHQMTAVAADALYVKPYKTKYLMLGPGQTTDVLITAKKPCGRYYIAASAFVTAPLSNFANTTTTAILEYTCSPPLATPKMPKLPAMNDSATAEKFVNGLKSLHKAPVPLTVDESLFYTAGLGLFPCASANNSTCAGPLGQRFATSMNNFSFVFPSTAMLQAHYFGIPGVYTTDFPDAPLQKYNYTSTNLPTNLWFTTKATKARVLKYNATVQVVLQGTGILGGESHPIHLHGSDFFVVGRGFGNYDPVEDPKKFNLFNPQERNTVNLPANGWAALRFTAFNPGVWVMHCHLDVHIALGLGMVFIVEDGPTEDSKVLPPPKDLPKC